MRIELPLLSVLALCGPFGLSACAELDREPRLLSYGEHAVRLVQVDEEGNFVEEWEGTLLVEPFEDPPEIDMLGYWGGSRPSFWKERVYVDAIRNRGPDDPREGLPRATDYDKAILSLNVGGTCEGISLFAHAYQIDSYAISWTLAGNNKENPFPEGIFSASIPGLISFKGPGCKGRYDLLFRRKNGTWTNMVPYETELIKAE